MTSRRRRILRVALAAVGTLALLYGLRVPLFGALLGRIVADRLAASLGGPVHIDQIGGSWVSGVVITGAQGSHLAGGVIPRMTCERLVIAWRPLDLLRGQGLAALTAIRAEGLVLEVAPRHSVGGGSAFDLATLAEPLPALDIAASVVVQTSAGEIRVRALRLISDGRACSLAVVGGEAPLVGALEPFALSIARRGDRLEIDGIDPIAGIVPRRITITLASSGAHMAADIEVAAGALALTATADAASASVTWPAVGAAGRSWGGSPART